MIKTRLRVHISAFQSNTGIHHGVMLEVSDDLSGQIITRGYFTLEEAGKFFTASQATSFDAIVLESTANIGKKHEVTDIVVEIPPGIGPEPYEKLARSRWGDLVRELGQQEIDRRRPGEGWVVRKPYPTNTTAHDTATLYADRYVKP